MGDECDENPTVNSTPRGLKYSAGHNHDDDLDSAALVGVLGISNASSLGRLFCSKVVLAMISRPPGLPLSGPGDIMIKASTQ
jgi:hypothetical protein